MSNRDEDRRKEMSNSGSSSNSSPNLEWRFNQTLRNVQGLLKGRSFPGKVLLTRKPELLNESVSPHYSQDIGRSYSDSDAGRGDQADNSFEGDSETSGSTGNNLNLQNLRASSKNSESTLADTQRSVSGARATDTARLTKFTKELSRSSVILGGGWKSISWSRRASVDRLSSSGYT